jgi:hypothetical protein
MHSNPFSILFCDSNRSLMSDHLEYHITLTCVSLRLGNLSVNNHTNRSLRICIQIGRTTPLVVGAHAMWYKWQLFALTCVSLRLRNLSVNDHTNRSLKICLRTGQTAPLVVSDYTMWYKWQLFTLMCVSFRLESLSINICINRSLQICIQIGRTTPGCLFSQTSKFCKFWM